MFLFLVSLALWRLARLIVGGSPVSALEVENAVLRHQLRVLGSAKRPPLTRRDRVLLVAASRLIRATATPAVTDPSPARCSAPSAKPSHSSPTGEPSPSNRIPTSRRRSRLASPAVEAKPCRMVTLSALTPSRPYKGSRRPGRHPGEIGTGAHRTLTLPNPYCVMTSWSLINGLVTFQMFLFECKPPLLAASPSTTIERACVGSLG